MSIPPRPNIILILADDMGVGDIGRFNGEASRTTALDDLISDGLSLSQHYSASPVCAPARAALLTGRYPHRTGAIDTLEARGLDRMALREHTLAEGLAAAGYRTGLVGKWHSGAIGAAYHPNRRGFEEFVGFRGGWCDYWDWRLERNGAPWRSDGRYLTDVLTEEAIGFVRRHRAEPFFLHLAYSAPHYPFQAPDDLVAEFEQPGRTKAVATIYAMLQVMDRGLASLREELSALGLTDNTLIMFSSDNGPQFNGEGEASTHRFNCGFAGSKLLVYEGGIRVPMIMSWPDGLPAGATSDAMVHFTDWLPTLAGLAGASLPRDRHLDGSDVRHVLEGCAPAREAPRFWQWNRFTPLGSCNAAMRDGNWKLVRPALESALHISPAENRLDEDFKRFPERYPSPVEDPPPEVPADTGAGRSYLFDLEADPGEQHDLAELHPDVVRRMETALSNWFEEVEEDRRSINA